MNNDLPTQLQNLQKLIADKTKKETENEKQLKEIKTMLQGIDRKIETIRSALKPLGLRAY